MTNLRNGIMYLLLAGSIFAFCSCATTELDWQQASNKDTIQAYENFMREHPNTDLATKARHRLQELQLEMEKADWQHAESEDTIESYVNFIEKYPDSPKKQKAFRRVIELRKIQKKNIISQLKAKIKPYAVGETTEIQFKDDGWNCKDPFYNKPGVVDVNKKGNDHIYVLVWQRYFQSKSSFFAEKQRWPSLF